MKSRFLLSVIMALLLQNICQAQDPDKNVLMTVAGRDVEAGEFIRMYQKKSGSRQLKPILILFCSNSLILSLKWLMLLSEGYDTTKAFRNELNGYRNQLAQSYLTDPDIKEKLLHQAYERSLYEVNASHILIGCAPDASPEDTAKAYGKAMEARKRILGGEPFETGRKGCL